MLGMIIEKNQEIFLIVGEKEYDNGKHLLIYNPLTKRFYVDLLDSFLNGGMIVGKSSESEAALNKLARKGKELWN